MTDGVVALDRGKAFSADGVAIVGVLVAVCFLATGGIFVKLSALEPITTGMWRVALAMPIAYCWARLEEGQSRNDRRVPSGKTLFLLWLAGVFLGLDLALWNVSFSFTSVANANLLANLVPFIVVPAAWLTRGERATPMFLAGLVLAAGGVVLLLARKLGAPEATLLGDGLAIATAVFYGFYLLTVSALRRTLSAARVMYYSSFGCMSVLVPLSLVLESRVLPATLGELAPLLALAALAHVGGQGLLAQCLRYVPTGLSSVLVLIQPIVAAGYAWALFGERLGPVEIAGVLVCLNGIFLAKRSHG